MCEFRARRAIMSPPEHRLVAQPNRNRVLESLASFPTASIEYIGQARCVLKIKVLSKQSYKTSGVRSAPHRRRTVSETTRGRVRRLLQLPHVPKRTDGVRASLTLSSVHVSSIPESPRSHDVMMTLCIAAMKAVPSLRTAAHIYPARTATLLFHNIHSTRIFASRDFHSIATRDTAL